MNHCKWLFNYLWYYPYLWHVGLFAHNKMTKFQASCQPYLSKLETGCVQNNEICYIKHKHKWSFQMELYTYTWLANSISSVLGNQEESKKSYLWLTIGIIRLAPMFILEKQRKSRGLSLDLREHVHNTYHGYVCWIYCWHDSVV